MSTSKSKTLANVLDRRIPRNPKYENVQSTLDTGDSLTRFLKRNEELRASGKQQVGEVFERMKISTMVQLIIQVAEINALDVRKLGGFDSIASQRTLTNTNRSETRDSQRSIETTRSTLEGVIRGVGEVDVYKTYEKRFFNTGKSSLDEQMDLELNERPYLLVDLRDKDEFKTNHIISAYHYPAAMLSRCFNNESKELLIYECFRHAQARGIIISTAVCVVSGHKKYSIRCAVTRHALKNQKGKIIILYDEDERLALPAATIMVERGYRNIFVLSGGLKYAVRKFPRGLLTGACPLSWTLASTPQTPSTKAKRLPSINPTYPETPSSVSTRPSPGPMITFNLHEHFTPHDIAELNTQLEHNTLSIDSGTRLSRSITSKQSSRSSINSEQSHFSHISDKPWKP